MTKRKATVCPPMPAAGFEPFDNWIFDQRHIKAFRKEAQVLDFPSIERAHNYHIAAREGQVPLWTRNGPMLRAVIMAMVSRLRGCVRGVETFPQLLAADKEVMGRLKKNPSPASRKRMELAGRVGGNAALIAGILWRSYRVGLLSTDIAEDTGASPPLIRQILFRANLTARRLFPDPELHECKLRHVKARVKIPKPYVDAALAPVGVCKKGRCARPLYTRFYCKLHADKARASGARHYERSKLPPEEKRRLLLEESRKRQRKRRALWLSGRRCHDCGKPTAGDYRCAEHQRRHTEYDAKYLARRAERLSACATTTTTAAAERTPESQSGTPG
jgi:hypothetical protein